LDLFAATPLLGHQQRLLTAIWKRTAHSVYITIRKVDTMRLIIFVICTAFSVAYVESVGIVAFSAGIPDFKTFAVGDTVKFTKVFTNFGDGYDSNTGIFTATKPGLYYFSISATSQRYKYFGLNMYHNEEPVIKIFGNAENRALSGANSILLRLKSRDRVYVKAFWESFLYGESAGSSAMFNGFLVSL
ncbi:unnamed protein product, partial [Candidula unifasciata]